MEVQIDNRQSIHRIAKKRLRQTAKAILSALDCPNAELSILIVDNQQIAKLNREFFNRKGPTNVIAFPMQAGQFSEISPNLLGDVVISIETALQESRNAGLSMEERVNQLLIHGILHLLGYDHVTTESEARKMEKKASKLLKIIEKEVRDGRSCGKD
jgi:probable rRNA maturation factor